MTVSSQERPPIFEGLPEVVSSQHKVSSKAQQRLDLLMIALEAVEPNSGEQLLNLAQSLKLSGIVRRRVGLWYLRRGNPWRRFYHRQNLTQDQTKALTCLIATQAQRLMVPIRQLLVAESQMRGKYLPVGHHFQLSCYLKQFRAYFRTRMNSRRVKVQWYLADDDRLDDLALDLLKQALLCTGSQGAQRLWISLFDGEV